MLSYPLKSADSTGLESEGWYLAGMFRVRVCCEGIEIDEDGVRVRLLNS